MKELQNIGIKINQFPKDGIVEYINLKREIKPDQN